MTEEVPASAPEASVRRGVILVFAAALGLTLLMAAPLMLAPSERLFGSRASLPREDPNRDALTVIDQFRTGQSPVSTCSRSPTFRAAPSPGSWARSRPTAS